MKRPLLRLLRSALLVYVGLLVIFAAFQRRLIYFPGRNPWPEEKIVRVASEMGLERWLDPQGQPIGWRQKGPASGPASARMVVFHGNAGTALDRDFYAKGFGRIEEGRTWQVFLFEYPGYDGRPGTPSEETFKAASRAALDALLLEDARPIYLLGESLGSGAACALAGEKPDQVAGIFLLTPFSSIGGVARHHYPWMPISLILREKWENIPALQKYRGPLAIMIAAEDEVVTAAEGRQLFDSYAGTKHLWTDPDAGHNTVANSPFLPWWAEVSDFLRASTAPRLSPP